MFVVLGAGNIKEYSKRSFSGTRPCILHILPYATCNRMQSHDYNQACQKIRTWLNVLWCTIQCNNGFQSMPFTHKSMSMTRLFGKRLCYLITHHVVNTQLMSNFLSSLLSKIDFKYWTVSTEICISNHNTHPECFEFRFF